MTHRLMKSCMLQDLLKVLLKSSIIINKEVSFRMCLFNAEWKPLCG